MVLSFLSFFKFHFFLLSAIITLFSFFDNFLHVKFFPCESFFQVLVDFLCSLREKAHFSFQDLMLDLFLGGHFTLLKISDGSKRLPWFWILIVVLEGGWIAILIATLVILLTFILDQNIHIVMGFDEFIIIYYVLLSFSSSQLLWGRQLDYI